MRLERSSGVLLHPTCLPGPFGIGDLGPAARRWIDFLAGAGCRAWQILPLGPTGFGESPYQCFAAFAGNPALISPETLVEDGLLEPGDLEGAALPADRVDYRAALAWKAGRLERAFERFAAAAPAGLKYEFSSFREACGSWLDDYALFMALKSAHGGRPWTEWPEPLRARRPEALAEARARHAAEYERAAFGQFLFFRQWDALRGHAEGHGVRIVGDLPIFVAHDSADVWAHPWLFHLDERGAPVVVAGVPPDYFSPTGQRWGNPVYRWEEHAASGYAWWLERLRAILRMVDIVRLDHFRGFAGYWEVPAGDATAERGRWAPGPGPAFLRAVREALGELPIIAEDLGRITPDVIALRDEFALPGMKVLQFAFSGPDNQFLPHHHPENCVVYTGTHDNDTTRGWFETAPEPVREFCLRYLARDGRDIAWDLVRAAWSSVAALAVAPMQDLLDLGSEARMNYPGTVGGNWTWRLPAESLDEALQARLRELNYLYQRL